MLVLGIKILPLLTYLSIGHICNPAISISNLVYLNFILSNIEEKKTAVLSLLTGIPHFVLSILFPSFFFFEFVHIFFSLCIQ